MKAITIFWAGISVVLMFAAGPVAAGSDVLQTLARITMNLNHFPSDEDKALLETIIDSDDASEEEAAIAMALANMQHKVTQADAERLADIVDDELADPEARQLAGTLLGINHSASDEDKVILAELAGD